MLLRRRARKSAYARDITPKIYDVSHGAVTANSLSYRPGCRLCRVFYKFNKPLTHHKIYPPGLAQSSRGGCQGCTIIHNAITQIWGITPDQVQDLYLDFEPHPARLCAGGFVPYRLMLFAVDHEDVIETYPAIFFWKNTGDVGELGPLISKDSVYPTIPIRRQIVPVRSLAGEVEWVNERLRECSQHESCPQAKYTGRGPKRLIDVGTIVGSKSTPAVRVVDTPNRFVQYTALSYCWGASSRKHVLTKKNLFRYQQAIPVTALLKTFADAVEFTRLLQIRYIWIDAFCIIQDDVEDWKCEAEKMCDVYRNSTLTLSALGFANPEEGLFKRSTDRVLLNMEDYDPPFTIYAKALDDCPLRWTTNTGRITQHQLPMMSRGWCYQERLLAVRTVHFTREELAWDCREKFCCQCQPSREDQPFQVENADNPVTAKTRHSQALALDDPHALKQRWQRIVADFTRLSLTVDSDRLHAIHGVATELQEKGLGPYHYGLWQNTIVRDLGWMKLDSNSTTPNQTLHTTTKRIPGIPTWSWASVNAAVTYQGDSSVRSTQWHDLCTFIDIRTSQRTGKYAFVPVETNHRLILRGQYAGGWLDRRRGLLASPSNFRIEGETVLDIDTHTSQSMSGGSQHGGEEGYYYALRLAMIDDGSSACHVQYLVLRHVLGDIEGGTDVGAAQEKIQGQHGAGDGLPVFERVGLLRGLVMREQYKRDEEWFGLNGTEGVVMIQ